MFNTLFNFEGPKEKRRQRCWFFLVKLKRRAVGETEWKQEVWNATCTAQRNLQKTVDNNILALEKQTCEYGGVAQLGEHLPCKQGVDSSILFISTTSCAGGKTR